MAETFWDQGLNIDEAPLNGTVSAWRKIGKNFDFFFLLACEEDRHLLVELGDFDGKVKAIEELFLLYSSHSSLKPDVVVVGGDLFFSYPVLKISFMAPLSQH